MKWLKESILENKKISLEEVISIEGNRYPLLKELELTEQDPEWHSEGNVFIHTNMVIEEMYKIFDEVDLTLSEKYILLMSAIFHDIAKPITSKWREVRGKMHLTSRGHEYEGMSYLTYRLMSENISKKEYDSILDLVGHHNLPKLFVIKDESIWNYKLLTEKTSGKMFYLLELADMRGRTCVDKQEQLDYMELFKMYTMDYDCFENESNIDNELKSLFKVNFNEKSEKALSYLIGKTKTRLKEKDILDPLVSFQKYYDHKDNHGIFFLMCGLSGSGKTTRIEEIKKSYDNVTVIELDALRKLHKQKSNNRREIDGRVRQESKEIMKRALANKEIVVFDACNHRKDFRDVLFDLAESYHAKTVLVFVETELSECIKNDKERSIRTVGKDVILAQQKQFEYPDRFEANEVY